MRVDGSDDAIGEGVGLGWADGFEGVGTGEAASDESKLIAVGVERVEGDIIGPGDPGEIAGQGIASASAVEGEEVIERWDLFWG